MEKQENWSFSSVNGDVVVESDSGYDSEADALCAAMIMRTSDSERLKGLGIRLIRVEERNEAR